MLEYFIIAATLFVFWIWAIIYCLFRFEDAPIRKDANLCVASVIVALIYSLLWIITLPITLLIIVPGYFIAKLADRHKAAEEFLKKLES